MKLGVKINERFTPQETDMFCPLCGAKLDGSNDRYIHGDDKLQRFVCPNDHLVEIRDESTDDPRFAIIEICDRE